MEPSRLQLQSGCQQAKSAVMTKVFVCRTPVVKVLILPSPYSNTQFPQLAADWCFNIADLLHSRKLVSLFIVAPYRQIPIVADNIDAQFPP
ncbi:hypothetical protein TNCV_845031 [Trichonephila clavipes]|uniref:Uncharacterized protein n=1 Tax=Trichonephila clavipes TaxID=2585209 RepID=A0A8X6WGT5_TRICX|nr:hypothetical protein TNCV_845031 [Trichonephila clavipes]